jgi:hypothetical protein
MLGNTTIHKRVNSLEYVFDSNGLYFLISFMKPLKICNFVGKL